MSFQDERDEPRGQWEHPALSEARRLARAEMRKPDLGDAPKLSALPMTHAARVALELSRGERTA